MSSSGADDVLKHDWYHIVDCPMDASREVIGKAIRKLSLLYHPDKDKSAKAAEMFLLVQKAKDVLLDDAARATYDTAFRSVKKRKEHDAMRKTQMDASKKRLRDELEERMRKVSQPHAQGHDGVGGKHHAAPGASKKAREDRDEIIRQLRQQNLGAVHAHGDEAARHEVSMKEQILRGHSAAKARVDAAKNQANACSIKVRWRRNDESHSEESLMQAFREFGGIEAITINAEKGTSAVIIFSDEASAQKAVDAHADATMFKVSRLDEPKRADIFTHVYANADTAVPTVFRADGSIKTGPGHDGAAASKVPEDSILLSHMRRAVEKEELMRTLQQQQQQPSDSAPAAPSEATSPSQANKTTPAFTQPPSASVFSIPRSADGASSKSNLASRESDVLRKMMETAALLKKAKDAAAASAANT
jgi:curved DNA-binding protein CbpA